MSTSFFIKKKKTKCLGFLAYLLFLLYKWQLVSDIALTSELGMSTPTPIEVDGWRLLFALWMGGIDDNIGIC